MSTPADQIALLQAQQAANIAQIDVLNQNIVANQTNITQAGIQISIYTSQIADYQNQNSILDDIIAEITPPPAKG